MSEPITSPMTDDIHPTRREFETWWTTEGPNEPLGRTKAIAYASWLAATFLAERKFNDENGPMHMGEPVIPPRQPR